MYELTVVSGGEGDVGGVASKQERCQASDPSWSVKPLDIFNDGPQRFHICKRDTTGYFDVTSGHLLPPLWQQTQVF